MLPRSVDVDRDVWFDGRHFVGPEQFFAAHVLDAVVSPRGLHPNEVMNLIDHRWFTWREVGALDERVEPSSLRSVLVELLPDGPWSGAVPS